MWTLPLLAKGEQGEGDVEPGLVFGELLHSVRHTPKMLPEAGLTGVKC